MKILYSFILKQDGTHFLVYPKYLKLFVQLKFITYIGFQYVNFNEVIFLRKLLCESTVILLETFFTIIIILLKNNNKET